MRMKGEGKLNTEELVSTNDEKATGRDCAVDPFPSVQT